MNIFGIIGLCFLLGVLFTLIWFLIVLVCSGFDVDYVPDNALLAGVISGAVIFIASIFVWIGSDTTNERIYVEKFQAQKTTIEQSIESETLSSVERIELVKTAVELNGEFAERKAKFDVWYHLYYDNSIYDDVEPIVFDTEVEE